MKPKILLFVFAALLVVINARAQDFWEELPFPDSLDISRVAVNAQGTILVGTVAGNCVSNGIYRSTDSGQSWQHVLNTGTFQIHSIGIDNAGHIYVCSAGLDVLWKSTDNGITWQLLDFSNDYPITKIYCIGFDSLLMGCARSNGVVLMKTLDGCLTFDTLFQTHNTSEEIRDIEIAPDGNIYIGLVGYFTGQGGIYKSADQGATWQYVGLQDYQVNNIEINQAGDIFIGARDMGTYAIYHDNPDEIKFLNGASSEGMVINSAGYIYVNSDWPSGTLCSYDNGESFTWVSTGSLNGPLGELIKDDQDYLYGISTPSPFLHRTKEPTYTGLINHITFQPNMSLYPNPTTDRLTGNLTGKGTCNGRYRISIINMSNQPVMEEEISVVSRMFTIPITALPTGLYVVRLTDNTETFQARFIKL